MPDKNAPKNATEMLDALFDFVQGPEEDVRNVPIEKVLKALKKQGLDPGPLAKMIESRLAAARASESLNNAREERGRIAQLYAQLSRKKIKTGDVKEHILDILRSKPELATAYRRFEQATDADLESLLEDLSLLERFSEEDEK